MSWLNYDLLRLIWFFLLGFLLIGFTIADGLNMGVCMLMPLFGSKDSKRDLIIETIEPFWESNQVWLILGAGATFAAWPHFYSVLFSAFYSTFFVILFSLILRPLAFKFRGKINNSFWVKSWDCCLFLSGIIPSFLLGVLIGNGIKGIPFSFDSDLKVSYQDFEFLDAYSVFFGLFIVFLMMSQGAFYLNIKGALEFLKKIQWMQKITTFLSLMLFCMICYWTYFFIKGYKIVSKITQIFNPLQKYVITESYSILLSQNRKTVAFFVFGLAILTSVLSFFSLKKPLVALILNSTFIALIFSFFGILLFPFLLPSALQPSHSLCVFDAASSELTLFIMLIAVIFLFPLVLLCIGWMYRVLRGRIEEMEESDNY